MRVFAELLLPTFLVHLTRALLITTLPLFVRSTLELSKVDVGIAVGAIGLGKVLSDVPAGYLLEKIGPRSLMIVCGSVACISALLMMMVTVNRSFELVVFSMVLCGAGESVGVISRLATVSDEIPIEDRGRVSANLGGSLRIAMAVGPLISGAIVTLSGSSIGVFLAQAILSIFSVLAVLVVRKDTGLPAVSNINIQTAPVRHLTGKEILISLFHISVFILALQLVRECRKLLIPLASFSAGMSVQDVSLVTSISFTIDALLFPYAGRVMDGYGRVFTGILSVSVMSLALLIVVPVTTFNMLLLFGILSGVGNGFSSGIIVAFGADMAPKDTSKSKFLGYFRLCADLGELVGPLVVGFVAQFTSIPTMLNTTVTVGIVGCVWLMTFVPDIGWRKFETSDHPRPHAIRMREFGLDQQHSVPIR
jgi:MFS family permease